MYDFVYANNITGPDISSCGTACMLSIAAAALFLVGAVAMIVACWRLDRVHKAVRGKFTQDIQDLSAPLSDYVDRGTLIDNLQLSFDMTTALQSNINKYTVSTFIIYIPYVYSLQFHAFWVVGHLSLVVKFYH